jgi:hypothetical protein
MSMMMPSIGDKRPKMPVFTIEECVSCNLKTKRPFKMGDFVFKDAGECTHCHSKARVSMIYAELVKAQ